MTQIRVLELSRGHWDAARDIPGAELLVSVIEGLIVCELAVGDIVSSRLLSDGDLIACGDAFETTLPRDQTWTALSPARVGVIDVGAARSSSSWPRVAARLTSAFADQLRRSAQLAAIGHRGPRSCADVALRRPPRPGDPHGVVVPVDLTHVVVGQLIGPRRSTVSLALRRRDPLGHVRRRDDGSWVLSHESAAELFPSQRDGSRRSARSGAAVSLARRRQAATSRDTP